MRLCPEVSLPLAAVLAIAAIPVCASALVVTGTVTDSEAQPLAGVSIAAPGTAEDHSTATDAEGRFALEVPEGAVLQFSKNGFLSQELDASAGEEIHLQMRPAAALHVHLRDARGRPVAGADAKLLVALPRWGRNAEAPGPVREEPTDAEGRAHFDQLPAGSWRLEIDAEGHRPTRRIVQLQQGERREATIRLEPAVLARGKVIDADGRPVPGARIGYLLYAKDHPNTERAWGTGGWGLHSRWEEADEEGGFAVPVPFHLDERGEPKPTAPYLVVAAEGHGPALVELPFRGPDLAIPDLEVRLPAPATLRGIIVDEEGEPVAGMELQVMVRVPIGPADRPRHPLYEDPLNSSSEPDAESPALPHHELLSELSAEDSDLGIRTDERGAFRVPLLPEGRVWLADPREDRVTPPWSPIEIRAAESKEIEPLVLARGGVVEGRVENERGEPVEGARVFAYHERYGEGGGFAGRQRQTLEARTSAEGAFRFAGIEEGVRLKVEAEGYGLWWGRGENRGWRRFSPEDSPLLIRLTKGARLEGRVYDQRTGAPIPAFHLKLEVQDHGPDGSGEASVHRLADPDGRIEVADLAAGTYLLSIDARGHLSAEISGVELRPGETTVLPPIYLDRGITLSGRVTRRTDGQPISGVSLLLRTVDTLETWGRGSSWNRAETTTDEDGSYEIAGLAPWEVWLRAEHPDLADEIHALRLDRLDDPRLDHDIAMGEGARVTIRAVDPNDQPVAGGEVILIPDRFPPDIDLRAWHKDRPVDVRTTLDGTGTAVLEHVAEGAWNAVLYDRGREYRRELHVRDGEQRELVFEEEGLVLAGRILHDGQPALEAELEVDRTLSWPTGRRVVIPRTVIRDVRLEEGHFETPPLPPDTYELRARQGRLSVRRVVTVGGDETGRRELQLHLRDSAPAARVRGRVVRADDRSPVAEATVEAGTQMWAWRSAARTDEEGAFNLGIQIPSGRTPLIASARNLRTRQPVYVTIEEGSDIEGLTLVLEPMDAEALEVVVRDPFGRPVRGARVRYRSLAQLEADRRMDFSSGFPGSTGGTDRDGRMELRRVERGEGILYAAHFEYAPAWKRVIIGRDESLTAEIALNRPASLEVRFPPEAAFGERTLLLRRPDLPQPIVVENPLDRMMGYNAHHTVTSDGQTLLPLMPEGTWTVEGSWGDVSWQDVVTLQPGDHAVVTFRSERSP